MTPEPIRVVVVDDDFAVAALHRAFVADLPGFAVVDVVHTGEAALGAVREHRPDLLLLDIYLPDMTGLEVLHRLREDPGSVVDVVAITAAREVETVRTAMAGGVLHYVIKPFTRADLHARLEDYRRHRSLVREAATEPLDQEQVDRLLGATRAVPTAQSLPKGLAARSMEMVVEALRSEPRPMSADDVAARVGMSRVAARRYLEHLAETGRAEVRPRYGRAGRPQNLYSWRSEGHRRGRVGQVETTPSELGAE